MKRSRAWRRSQDKRIVEKRKKIATKCWRDEDYVKSVPNGMFRKWNFTCSCNMCKMDKTLNAKEKKERQKAKASQISDF